MLFATTLGSIGYNSLICGQSSSYNNNGTILFDCGEGYLSQSPNAFALIKQNDLQIDGCLYLNQVKIFILIIINILIYKRMIWIHLVIIQQFSLKYIIKHAIIKLVVNFKYKRIFFWILLNAKINSARPMLISTHFVDNQD